MFERAVLHLDLDSFFVSVERLKNSELFSFDQLIDITVIDYPSREKRFELIYIFLSMKKNKRIILRTSIKENENLDSIISIFKASDWYERECYDLFGINFSYKNSEIIEISIKNVR